MPTVIIYLTSTYSEYTVRIPGRDRPRPPRQHMSTFCERSEFSCPRTPSRPLASPLDYSSFLQCCSPPSQPPKLRSAKPNPLRQPPPHPPNPPNRPDPPPQQNRPAISKLTPTGTNGSRMIPMQIPSLGAKCGRSTSTPLASTNGFYSGRS